MSEFTISKKGFKTVLLGVLMLLMTPGFLAQQKYKRKQSVKLGGGMEILSSGNCHGGMFAPLLSLNKGKHSISAAGFFQKRSSEFVGGRFAYSINLTEGCSRLKYYDDDEEDSLYVYVKPVSENEKPFFYLSAFLSAQYYHQTLLSKSAINIENKTRLESSVVNWNSYRMSTVELAAGVELNFRLAKRITWKNTIGMAVYNHLDYSSPMYSAKAAPTLMLATGIHICPL